MILSHPHEWVMTLFRQCNDSVDWRKPAGQRGWRVHDLTGIARSGQDEVVA
jgi:hypothetical protein